MRLLLDTHILLWALLDPDRLDAAVVALIVAPEREVFVSAVTAWEIAIKQSIGKLDLPGPTDVWLPEAVRLTGFDWLPVSPTDALRVARLPWHHRDPFDRLLIAQAMGGFTLITHDRAVARYATPVVLNS